MQSLLGGADCSTSSNPLKQVAQREGVDNSLFRDRYTGGSPAPGPGSSSSSVPFRSSLNRPPASTQLHVNQTPHPFNLSHLSAALADPSVQSGSSSGLITRPPHQQQGLPIHFDQSWDNHHVASPQRFGGNRGSPSPFAAEFNHSHQQAPRSDWAEGFDGKGKARAMSPPSQQQLQQYDQQSNMNGMNGMNGYGYQPQQNYRMPYQPTFQPMYSGYQQPQQFQPQHQMNGHQQEIQALGHQEMEAAFEQALKDAQAQADREAAEKLQEEKEKSMPRPDNVWLDRYSQWGKQFTEEDKQKEAEGKAQETQEQSMGDGIEDRGEAKGDFEKVWESLKPDAERLDKLAEWESDFTQFTKDNDDLFETLNDNLNQPGVGQASLDQQMDIGTDFANQFARPTMENGLPQRKEYDFAHPNKFDSHDPQAAWAEANHLLSSGGSLTDASLLLESYLRRATSEHFSRPGQSEVEAWSLLGQTHAMDEKEEKALAAFEEGREVLKNGDGPAVGEMLTNLAISYVNESYDLAALQVLYQYLMLQHSQHAGSQPTHERMLNNPNPWGVHQEMRDMFLNVAKDQFARNGQVDPDLQVGLGTLYYMQGDYDEARDCWVAALGERPSDYLLWNRLGATLANGGNPEEAVDAYRRALELKPTFTRAIFNLGVACLNIGVHREAAEHFLAALSLHARSENPDRDMLGMGGEGGNDSSTLWMTLRRALTALELHDLAEKAKPGTDLGMFRQAGFEF